MVALSVLAEEFGICRLSSAEETPDWLRGYPLYFVARTSDELSVLCPVSVIPDSVLADRQWRCLKVDGPIDFDEVGILASLAKPLAEVGIAVLAVSTYDTDYLFVKRHELSKAIEVLNKAGHRIEQEEI
ncbi:MAG: ACT domain-containing protein [Deltaproteobacteria bacterium]|nr:MAG: ACT domain-containing protein [Deltaproteobacteria bacterium]